MGRQYDLLQARRHHVLAALAHRLRSWRGDGNRLVPLDEVADPVSWRGERQLGPVRRIRLDTIIGAAEPHRINGASGPPPTGAITVGAAGAGPAARWTGFRQSRSTASTAAIS